MPDISAWRIDKKKWAGDSFSGRGAALEGGRWNSAGVAAVYVSQHLSMAVLETFVHLPRPFPHGTQHVKFSVLFGNLPVTHFAAAALPEDWRWQPSPASTQKIGDGWIRGMENAILALPSVLIPEETNYLLNPAHPDFRQLKISAPEPFAFDPRMV